MELRYEDPECAMMRSNVAKDRFGQRDNYNLAWVLLPVIPQWQSTSRLRFGHLARYQGNIDTETSIGDREILKDTELVFL